MPYNILPVSPKQLRHKFGQAVKGHSSIIIWTNLVGLEVSMLYTKVNLKAFLGFGEEDFKCFLPYMGMVAILFNGAEPFEQIANTPLTECPVWNQVKIYHAVSEKTF